MKSLCISAETALFNLPFPITKQKNKFFKLENRTDEILLSIHLIHFLTNLIVSNSKQKWQIKIFKSGSHSVLASLSLSSVRAFICNQKASMIFLHCTKAFSLSITASNLALNTFVMILYTIPKRLKGLKFLSRTAKFFLEILLRDQRYGYECRITIRTVKILPFLYKPLHISTCSQIWNMTCT